MFGRTKSPPATPRPIPGRITVQVAGPVFLRSIEAVERHGETVDPWCLKDFERTLSDGHITYVVGRAGLAVVGYACGYHDRASKCFEIGKVCVIPAFRRQGIGRAMVSELCRAAHTGRPSTWPESIRTTVWERRVEALQFFAACGFGRAKLLRDAFDVGEDMIRQTWLWGAR